MHLLLKAVAALCAAAVVGTWFLDEVKRARSNSAPWYAPYLSPPGLIILAALSVPIWIKIFS